MSGNAKGVGRSLRRHMLTIATVVLLVGYLGWHNWIEKDKVLMARWWWICRLGVLSLLPSCELNDGIQRAVFHKYPDTYKQK